MSQNVLPPGPLKTSPRWPRTAALCVIFALFLPSCDERRQPLDRPTPPPRPRPTPAVSSAPPAAESPSAGLLERPPEPDPDPPGASGDLRAEIDAFHDLRTCARAHRLTDPLLADAVEALHYDTFVTDACRTLEALKAQDVAPCAGMMSTALRQRCEAHVAMLTGRPDLCPLEERVARVLEHATSCLAAARRDVRPCVVLAGIERATCEGLVAHDAARCGLDERCLRLVRRWQNALPVALGRPPHESHLEVTEEPPPPGTTPPLHLAREAEVGAVVVKTATGAQLLVGDPRPFFITDEISGGGFVLDLPAWPPDDTRLTLDERKARVTLRHRAHGVLELTRTTSVKVEFEAAPADLNRPLKLRLVATVGPSTAPRTTVWNLDTWLRDLVLPPAPSASASASAAPRPPRPPASAPRR